MRIRGNGFTLTQGRVRGDIGEKFFLVRVLRPSIGCPREAAAVPSLKLSKARLDGA